MSLSPKLILGGAFAALLGFGGWLLVAGDGNLRYYKAAEFAALTKNPGACQVHGTVAAGSVERLPVGVRFVLQDGAARIPVEYRDIVPDAFAENRELVVEGRGDANGFRAERLLVKCPSKYNPAQKKARAGAASSMPAAVPANPAPAK